MTSTSELATIGLAMELLILPFLTILETADLVTIEFGEKAAPWAKSARTEKAVNFIVYALSLAILLFFYG